MALWVNDRIAGRTAIRMAYFTPTVLPMIAVANIWLFFYTPQYGLLEQVTGALGLLLAQLARLAGYGARRRHRGGDLEGSRLLHDLLSGGAAEHLAEPRRGRSARRRLALDLLSPRAVSAADADHAVRAGQRGDQRVPHGRPHHRDDARRAGQRHHACCSITSIRSASISGTRPTRPRSPPCCWRCSRSRPSCNTACSSGGSTTDDRAPRSLCAERRLARAGKRRRRTAGDPVGAAARLCGVGGVSSGRVHHALRAARAADARQLRARLGRRAVRALLPQHVRAGDA